MKRILAGQSAIYNQFHGSSAFSVISQRGDDYAAYYTAMYLIQDTGEAVDRHLASDFSSDPLTAYLMFWGVMQAIFIQQDAISELHRVIVGSAPPITSNSAWSKLRDKRNVCAGHPANRDRGVPASQRSFMGRSFGNYTHVTYELWDDATETTTHPSFNLQKMIDDYDKEARDLLKIVLG